MQVCQKMSEQISASHAPCKAISTAKIDILDFSFDTGLVSQALSLSQLIAFVSILDIIL